MAIDARPRAPGPSNIGSRLRASALARMAELAIVAAAATATLAGGWAIVGHAPLARQAVAWVTNVELLALIWLGLRLRGESWEHLGLGFRSAGIPGALRTIGLSLIVFAAAVVAFLIGGGLMVRFVTNATGPDTGGYAYLQGNLPMLLLALTAVYVVSSFGEEVIYRGFLITRLSELLGNARAARLAAVAGSAAIFGLVHFDWGVVGIVQTAFMGLALGLSYLLTGRRLWALVLAHGYMDTLLLVQLYAS